MQRKSRHGEASILRKPERHDGRRRKPHRRLPEYEREKSKQLPGPRSLDLGETMRLVHIRARNDDDVGCLMRELSPYSPKRAQRVVQVELEVRSHADLLALLRAVETCLSENDIRSVCVEIEGKPYLMTPAVN